MAAPAAGTVGMTAAGAIAMDSTREELGLGPLRPQFGNHIRHKHGGRWERKATKKGRMFRQNVHKRRLLVQGEWVSARVTARELRTLLKRTTA